MHGYEDNAKKGEAQDLEDKFAAILCCIVAVDGHAQFDQHGLRHRRLRRGSAYAIGCPAFLSAR